MFVHKYNQMKRLNQVSCHLSALKLMMILFVLTSLQACSKRYDDMPAYLPFPIREYENHSVGRFKTSYLASQIDEYYRGMNPGPIGVTTFVNLDDLYTTSTFGRVYGEQLMSELTMRGFDVVELRHSDALQFLSDSGEFALSRDIAAVRRERDLGALVVGTYVASPVRVYVNARLVDPSSSLVISAASVEMEKTKEIAKLLRGGGTAATLERIPVKHLGLSTYPLHWFNPQWKTQSWEEEPGSFLPSGANPATRRVEPEFKAHDGVLKPKPAEKK